VCGGRGGEREREEREFPLFSINRNSNGARNVGQ